MRIRLARASEIEISRVGGSVATRVDRVESKRQFRTLEALLDREERDATILAHRFAGSVWVADIFPL